MGLIQCRKCNKMVSDDNKNCPFCGNGVYVYNGEKLKYSDDDYRIPMRIKIVGFFFAVIGIGAALLLVAEKLETNYTNILIFSSLVSVVYYIVLTILVFRMFFDIHYIKKHFEDEDYKNNKF